MPEFDVARIAAIGCIGLVTGFATGFFGGGTGIMQMPFFIYLLPHLGVRPDAVMHVAIGTSLTLTLPTSAEAAYGHYKRGHLDLPGLRPWVGGLAAGAIVGAVALQYAPGGLLKEIFAVLTLAYGLYIFASRDTWIVATKPPTGLVATAIGWVLGVKGMVTGTTCGTETTITYKLCGANIKTGTAAATVTSVVMSLAGATVAMLQGHDMPGRAPHSFGYIDLDVVAAMLPTSLAGAWLGVRANEVVDDRVLKFLYGALLIGIGLDMLARLD